MQATLNTLVKAKLLTYQEVNSWHKAGWRTFDTVPVSLEACICPVYQMVLRNAYHNYQMWHLIEDYDQTDLKKSLFFFNGGKEQNTYRNETINALDLYFDKYQAQDNGVPVNSESIGSILDRANIAHIKFIHLNDLHKPESNLILSERKHLDICSDILLKEMLMGQRRYQIFSKFKIQYCEMDKHAQNIHL